MAGGEAKAGGATWSEGLNSKHMIPQTLAVVKYYLYINSKCFVLRGLREGRKASRSALWGPRAAEPANGKEKSCHPLQRQRRNRKGTQDLKRCHPPGKPVAWMGRTKMGYTLGRSIKEMASSIIVSNPAILSGEPVFRGTRVPFKSLTDYLGHERSLSEFLEDFPSVSRADAIAALEEARNSLTATLK